MASPRDTPRSKPAGTNRVAYSRRAGELRPGDYRTIISARDCSGRRSRSLALPFVVQSGI